MKSEYSHRPSGPNDGYGDGIAAGNGEDHGIGWGDGGHGFWAQLVANGTGTSAGTGSAHTPKELDEFLSLKRVPELITEIRRANAE